MNWQSQFPQAQDISYLNHAAVGPWPSCALRAVNDFATDNVRYGAAHYGQWLKTEQRLRQHLQNLIHCSDCNDIALLKNTSEALSVIAYGLSWRDGDNVVIGNQEFPSNRVVWESLRSRGVEVIYADLTRGESPEQSIIECINARTRLVSLSSVQYATGLKLDCATIGKACREQGVLFCIDAIQSIGAYRFEAELWQADFVVADGHKWMLGPEGVALFYSRHEAREQLALQQYGWHMLAHRGDYDRQDWAPLSNAQRFECGSPNMLGIHALEASLSLLLEIGMDEIERTLDDKVDYLLAGLRKIPAISILSPSDKKRRAGIVTFRHSKLEASSLYSKLLADGVICAPRGGGIRFSPHFYTPLTKIDYALDSLSRL